MTSTLASIAPHLSKVEVLLASQAKAAAPAVEELMLQGCAQGGKLLRPRLVLLSASALGEIKPSHTALAVALELIHSASLVHDDIMDGATQRRGRPTPNSVWGNRVAVKLGDLLMARALALVAGLGDRNAGDLVTEAASNVCWGEILQSRNIRNPHLTRSKYYEIVSLKTGSLFSAASGGAARLSGAREETVHAFSEFGRLTGLAYQIYDDCTDLTGTTEALGKTLGTDLEGGAMTLPVISFLEKYPATERAGVLELLRAQNKDPLAHTWRVFTESGAIADSVNTGLDFLQAAESHLAQILETSGGKLLGRVVDHIRQLFRGVHTAP